ncbi:hypothetical protein HFN_2379 [Helicobacter fennelliae MRY12-0050]|uniref:Uncharacterized protein n=1 Tax=Helicobacter fennelliae MRY12-0050 TaxID=1325130 RepID=T1CZU8_9HELI|nr:hypothetical protein HFN_2379 [Helicobacter fennelliae MRY12-0050]
MAIHFVGIVIAKPFRAVAIHFLIFRFWIHIKSRRCKSKNTKKQENKMRAYYIGGTEAYATRGS